MSLRDELRRLTQRLAGRRPSAEEERLVELFRNRAELKKELTALDEERHRLLDRLKLQEGATMRVEEQYAALEQYLGRPDEGYKSLAYFQLRALWRTGSKRLEQFAGDLARQQKDRERRAQMAEFERDKRARLGDVDREFVEAKVLADQLQAEQKLAQQRLGELAGFWNHFRRRKLEDAIAARALRLETAQAAVTDLGDARHAIEAEPPPAFEGISLEGKRAVNLAVVAYAEWLCDRLAADGLADLARQTTLRRVFESGYGGREECLALMDRAAKAIADLERQSDDLVELKSRTDRLRRSARYRGENDPIPMQDSISPPDNPGRTHGSVNVLLEEYFEIYGALLR
jgi:hypothetical protein